MYRYQPVFTIPGTGTGTSSILASSRIPYTSTSSTYLLIGSLPAGTGTYCSYGHRYGTVPNVLTEIYVDMKKTGFGCLRDSFGLLWRLGDELVEHHLTLHHPVLDLDQLQAINIFFYRRRIFPTFQNPVDSKFPCIHLHILPHSGSVVIICGSQVRSQVISET